MTSPSVEDVVDKAVVTILRDLERDGFRVELTPDDAIMITPKSGLTPERRQQIVNHKVAIKVLLRYCDEGVQVRRDAFRQQFEATATPMVPAFLFKVNISYVKGICFSCADALPELRFGRCWRCPLAWRLAVQLPIDGMLADALDASKMCA
jgi:hypothetical protein